MKPLLLLQHYPYFNSIKVRLKHEHQKEQKKSNTLFQFHKGTIKTCICSVRVWIYLEFQFHKGTIKTVCCLEHFLQKVYFNSIKVRLKLFVSNEQAALVAISIP